MTTDDAFLAAIAAAPDDLDARAVYADWLEQRADPRAEWLRTEEQMWREPLDLVRVRTLWPRRSELRRSCDPRWVSRVRPGTAELRRRASRLASSEPRDDAKPPLRPPLTEGELAAIEERIGCRLPAQYRQFVGEIGDGGAGPPHEIEPIANATETDLAQPFRAPKTATEARRHSVGGGVFTLSVLGCGMSYFLIMSGDDAGCVWYQTDRGHLVPLQANGEWGDLAAMVASPRDARIEFLDWYAQELDQSLYRRASATPDDDTVFDRDPEHVTDVNLEKRELRALPEDLRRLTHVRRLDVSHNPLEGLPRWLGELTRLEHVWMSYTAVRELPPELAALRALKRLSCFHCEALERVPGSLGELTSLEHLDLRYCALRELPESIGKLAQLDELQVHSNPLVSLPRAIGQLRQLRALKLQFCQIRALPDELVELPDLVEIDLRANGLRELPPVIGRLPRLERLSLVENPDLDLAAALRVLQHVPTLRRLHLSSMRLTQLPDEIGLLTQLDTLSLSYNRLTSLPDAITKLTRLREIDLQMCGFEVDWDHLWEILPGLGTSADDSDMIDETIPDGTDVRVGVPFTKTWRLRNTGRSAWVDGFEIVHVDGPDFGAAGQAVIARPGEEIEVSLEMVATERGLQRSTWQIANDGEPFGCEFWVEVNGVG